MYFVQYYDYCSCNDFWDGIRVCTIYVARVETWCSNPRKPLEQSVSLVPAKCAQALELMQRNYLDVQDVSIPRQRQAGANSNGTLISISILHKLRNMQNQTALRSEANFRKARDAERDSRPGAVLFSEAGVWSTISDLGCLGALGAGLASCRCKR